MRVIPHCHNVVLLLALTLAACSAPLVTLGTALADRVLPAGADQGQLVAEVVEVDELQRRIRVVTDDGRAGTVLYDQNTIVIREAQRLTVRALQTGDPVLIQVRRHAGDQLYAARVDIQPPARVAAEAAPVEPEEAEPPHPWAEEPRECDAPAEDPPDTEEREPPAEDPARPDPEDAPEPQPEPRERVAEFSGTISAVGHDQLEFLLETPDGVLVVILPDDVAEDVIQEFHRLESGRPVRLEAVPIDEHRIELRRFLD